MEIAVSGGGEKLYSQNLRDLLRIKEEDYQRNINQGTSSSSGGGPRSSTGLTLSAVLSEKGGHPPPVKEPPPQPNRTLLDIIREDQTLGLVRDREDGRRSWRHLKDRIRLRRRVSGHAWSSAVPVHNNHRITTTTQQLSIRFNSNTEPDESTQTESSIPSSHRNPSRLSQHNRQEDEERSGGAAAEGEVSPEETARTSLMALLAENDGQIGFESSAYMMDEDEDVEEEGAVVAVSAASAATANGGEYNSCCVCMVRRKGAALIPCGHTFCRLCSRELWVQRGNCPLCNNYILEVLDIF